ncbi:hypothetical protein HYDPIDRAFT_104581 [Hydnomerulius pinastri MD-312]|nr:hypothetical protein HYDPIDRAFT_104581 [Hydnomerulius pinastri MD-312]
MSSFELSTNTNVITFPPIHSTTRLASLARDPCGFLPWLRRIRFEANNHSRVLSFSNVTKALELWYWPVLEDGVRVTPDGLVGHRQTHHFLGPGCLCSSQSIDGTFTEALIFMVTTGQHAGKWVAACAMHRCKYWIFIEKLYNKLGLPLRAYPRREHSDPVPSPLIYDIENPPTPPNTPASSPFSAGFTLHRTASATSLDSVAATDIVGEPETPMAGPSGNPYPTVCLGKRRRAEVNFDPFVVSPAPRRQRPAKVNEFAMLMKLDAFNQPGLTVRQLKSLLTKCECGLIMTRRVYEEHDCVLEFEQEVIDLTGDD